MYTAATAVVVVVVAVVLQQALWLNIMQVQVAEISINRFYF